MHYFLQNRSVLFFYLCFVSYGHPINECRKGKWTLGLLLIFGVVWCMLFLLSIVFASLLILDLVHVVVISEMDFIEVGDMIKKNV